MQGRVLTPRELPMARWSGIIGFEQQLTGDGRFIAKNALRWENLPIPLAIVFEDEGAHNGAIDIGNIDEIKRLKGGAIWGSGEFDMGSEFGVEAHRLVKEKIKRGVSMDLDDTSFEIRLNREVYEEAKAQMEAILGEGETPEPEEAEDGSIIVAKMRPDAEVTYITDSRVRRATVVSIPAFAGALIEVEETAEEAEQVEAIAASLEAPPVRLSVRARREAMERRRSAADRRSTLVASAATKTKIPVEPPLDWFANPNLDEPTPLTITDDGRIFGHLAVWGTCHAAFPNTCVTPPSSPSAYSHFHLGAVRTAEGVEVPTGKVTMDTGHAGASLSAAATLAHYDNTGTVAADVFAGEDGWGIWVAGALRPEMTPAKIRALRASPLSGDWRRVGNNGLELVAALAVNVPGFPIPRPKAFVASGHQQSLVASGIVAPDIDRRMVLAKARQVRARMLADRVNDFRSGTLGVFAPNQPRVPKGQPGGGRWTNGTGGSPSSALIEAAASSHADKILGQAAEVEPEVTALLEEVFARTGAEFYKKEFRLKGKDSLTRKIRDRAINRQQDPAVVASKITDALRYTAVANPDDYADMVLDMTGTLEAKGYKVTQIENNWAGDDAPFHNVALNVQTPNGLVFELQAHTDDSIQRTSDSHFWYDFYRDPRLPAEVREEATERSALAWKGTERPDDWEKIPGVKVFSGSASKYVGGAPAPRHPDAKAPMDPYAAKVGDKVTWGGYRFKKVKDGWEYVGTA